MTRDNHAASSKSSSDPLIGTVIADRFKILSPLARGGMGRVYRALQVKLDREVAVKVLDTARDIDEELRVDFTRRFMLEAASLAKLNHPNTIVIHDYGEAGDNRYFIAMELLEGQTLRDAILSDGPMDGERVIRIGVAIASSLAEAHDIGMIHRDMKPANIFLTKRGDDHEFVKVLDFGLVKKEVAEKEHDYSSTGHMVGTPRYMAPEQILGGAIVPATDVYGLGATLYHALAGRPPFDGDSRFELLVKATDQKPTPPTVLVPDAGISVAIEAVILRCLNKPAEERYPDMRALAAALVDCSSFSGSWPMGGGLISGSHHIPKKAQGPAPVSGDFSGNLASTKVSKRSGVSSRVDHDELNKEEAAAPADESTTRPVGESTAGESTVVGTKPEGSSKALIAVAGGALLLSAIAVAFVLVQGMISQPAATPQPAEPTVTTEPVVHDHDPVAAPVTRSAMTRVRLVTTPPLVHARSEDESEDYGDTPVTLVIPEGESRRIELILEGYETRVITVVGGQEEMRVRLQATSRRPTRPNTHRPRPDNMGRTDNRDPFADTR